METRKTAKHEWGMMGAVGAALASSACCTIPFVLVSAGFGGAWLSNLTALEPYRPIFILAALLFLGMAFWKRYKSSNDPDCECEPAKNPRSGRVLLLVGTIATSALIISPWFLSAVSPSSAIATHSVDPSGHVLEVVLEVDGMTCETCPATVKMALERIDGVLEANVSYEPPLATVRFDGFAVSLDDLTRATSNVGFPSSPLQPDSK
ncbi:MAG: cation transporter [Bacteroidetes bacterium]|nr:cation transporter [Bacteroidota bacterium]